MLRAMIWWCPGNAGARIGLDPKDPFQPNPFCDSVKGWLGWALAPVRAGQDAADAMLWWQQSLSSHMTASEKGAAYGQSSWGVSPTHMCCPHTCCLPCMRDPQCFVCSHTTTMKVHKGTLVASEEVTHPQGGMLSSEVPTVPAARLNPACQLVQPGTWRQL